MFPRANCPFRPSLAEVLEDRTAMSHSGLLGGMPAQIVAGPIPAQDAAPVLSRSTYESIMAQIGSAFDAPRGGATGTAARIEQLSFVIHRLPLGASLWAKIPSDPFSVTGSSRNQIRAQIKREVFTFVRENVAAGRIVWQGPAGSSIRALAPTGSLVRRPPHFLGPVPANPPTSMTPFIA